MDVNRMEDDIDPVEILFDPNIILKANLFLYIFTCWASIPPSDTNPEEILSQYEVQNVLHKKMINSPEHEFLVIEAVDQSGQIKRFILDRTVSNPRQMPDPIAEPEALSHRIIERMKKFVAALSTLVSMPMESRLALMEEGSALQLSPGPLGILSIADKSTLSLTETASLMSDSLDISDNSVAFDRFLGENHVNQQRWQAETIRNIKPKNFTLFQLAVLSHAAHELHPTYSLLKEQCFFYAGIIFAAVHMNWGADASKMEGSDLHASSNFGRWKGYKVQRVDSGDVSTLISKYEEVHSQKVAKVF